MAEVRQELACVTGAAGFIGAHVVRLLLERGHQVRGTVRDVSDQAKTAHLRALPGAADRLELISADLLVPGSFDAAVAGCSWVFHVAAAVALHSKDPEREIVVPSVEGTANVLAAISKAGTVRAVGFTSSVDAIKSVHRHEGQVWTEQNWCEDATAATSAYPLAKVRSERLMWAANEELGIPLTVVNPSLVMGPVLAAVHLRSSPSVVKSIICGEFPAMPKLSWGTVDIQNVVEALVVGVERGTTGRYILDAQTMSMQEISVAIKSQFPSYKIRTWELPKPLMYLSLLWEKRISMTFLRNNLGRRDVYDNSKVEQELGIRFRPMDESLRDTVQSMIDLGFVPRPD